LGYDMNAVDSEKRKGRRASRSVIPAKERLRRRTPAELPRTPSADIGAHIVEPRRPAPKE